MKQVDDLLSQAEKLVLDEIEKRVTKILLNPKNRAVAFVMAMGGYCFYDMYGPLDDSKYMEPVLKLFEHYDKVFKLSGNEIKWDVLHGKIIKTTHWE